jgi:hypothetical protein
VGLDLYSIGRRRSNFFEHLPYECLSIISR